MVDRRTIDALADAAVQLAHEVVEEARRTAVLAHEAMTLASVDARWSARSVEVMQLARDSSHAATQVSAHLTHFAACSPRVEALREVVDQLIVIHACVKGLSATAEALVAARKRQPLA